MNLININSTLSHLELEKGKYYIYIVGGWGISLGDFSIKFRNANSNVSVITESTFLGMSTFISGKKAKKSLFVNIPTAGTYIVIFRNPESLKVTSFDFKFLSFIFNPVPVEQLKILVSNNNGFSMFKD